MKTKVSIVLSEELLRAVDMCARQQKKTRPAFIEASLWAFIQRPMRKVQDARDLEILNQQADFLNEEARDVLGYCHG